MEHIVRPGEEWGGQQSSKFLTSKLHVQPPKSRDVEHPLYSTLGRMHVPDQQFRKSDEFGWKPTRVVGNQPNHWIDKSTKKIIENFTIVKPISERMNIIDNMSLKIKEKRMKVKRQEQLEQQKIVQDLGTIYLLTFRPLGGDHSCSRKFNKAKDQD